MAKLWNDFQHFIPNGRDMDLIKGLKAVVATAQTGSFSAAAEQMGISNRLTSKYVGALEDHLGVRLFQRTTRKLGLTAAGEEMMTRAPALMEELDAMLAAAAQDTKGFTGTIRISAPVTFGEAYVNGALSRFAALHPGLEFDLRLTDAFSDLASEGIDLAIRLGVGENIAVKARKLGAFEVIAAASPAYLAAHGTPQTPSDLAQHTCILDTNRRRPAHWVFYEGETERAVSVTGRFKVNSARAAAELAVDGMGVVYGPQFALEDALSDGRLTALLPGYRGETSPISAVYLEGRRIAPKLRALIEFLREDIHRAGPL